MSPLWQKGHEGTHLNPLESIGYLTSQLLISKWTKDVSETTYFILPNLFIKPCKTFVLCSAALIRGNRTNCTQFSRKLDWLVSKLERLESSSGIMGTTFFSDPLVNIWKNQKLLHRCHLFAKHLF